MKKALSLSLLLLSLLASAGVPSRRETLLRDWIFNGSRVVRIPHDWAICGPFDRSNDLQTVAVEQNGETEATEKTGRSGGLPWMGKGVYECSVKVEKTAGSRFELLFDGAMSGARVFINGQFAGEWPYGYNSFHFDVTSLLFDGDNAIRVELENLEQSSRWYPGAGLYRKVRLIETPEVHVPVWGVYVTTPRVSDSEATVTVSTEIEGIPDGEAVTLETVLLDASGAEVARREDTRRLWYDTSGPLAVIQNFIVPAPSLWSPESPALYTARTVVKTGGRIDTEWNIAKWRNRITVTPGLEPCDTVTTRFGIRSVEVRPMEGFFLNGERTMFKGVCLHHDLGPLGAAVNRSAIRHQLVMLKDMGCNAVRTSHNMPAEELVELCDEMGLMLMVEPFDEWDKAKCENGYHRLWDDWAEKDMVNMLRHFRSNPSVVMWSIGNEVPSQWGKDGAAVARWLTSICHREDPSRPVTCGMDQFDGVLTDGFAAVLDVPGFNYKPERYLQAAGLLPQGVILGSETASTVSSRGVYHFPVTVGPNVLHPDNQSSSYDVEYCTWSGLPDLDFAADEAFPWMMGQFVWTGFDYLGEPSPYDTDAWPSHSSVFGIIDLASLPKDRFWLYRSVWNREEPTLHVLPHWTWPSRKGLVTPVVVYTSWPSAELFVNGVSKGRREFLASDGLDCLSGTPLASLPSDTVKRLMERHRLIWDDVVYEPGEIKVVAYDSDGAVADTRTVRTAGRARNLLCKPDRTVLKADGEDLAYVTVTVTDKDGNPVPDAAEAVDIEVKGAGSFEAIANGDPTCLESFREPRMHLFSGALTFIVRSGDTPGTMVFRVSGRGLKPFTGTVEVK
ncbi:MAG: DUF4982 domain-containing protein [Bacteroidales bacterium]|nr:DUF4982 domain-containing protein [Bacteroidales bacterium]